MFGLGRGGGVPARVGGARCESTARVQHGGDLRCHRLHLPAHPPRWQSHARAARAARVRGRSSSAKGGPGNVGGERGAAGVRGFDVRGDLALPLGRDHACTRRVLRPRAPRTAARARVRPCSHHVRQARARTRRLRHACVGGRAGVTGRAAGGGGARSRARACNARADGQVARARRPPRRAAPAADRVHRSRTAVVGHPRLCWRGRLRLLAAPSGDLLCARDCDFRALRLTPAHVGPAAHDGEHGLHDDVPPVARRDVAQGSRRRTGCPPRRALWRGLRRVPHAPAGLMVPLQRRCGPRAEEPVRAS
mmetsp:Transcript_9421/g.24410  ORF Transcript_9421/g.24410 Transcript_9421/m.24410 type:complete len:307 (-) Transcript_9421:339-1259(-)